jgi:8-oxo-dGTP pyrophosphatase MutT (NUDIX family)
VPGGKIEKEETPRMAVIREVWEEAGIDMNDEGLEEVGKLYCKLPHVEYVYHMFRKRFSEIPEVNLGLEEHLEMKWVTFEEALQLPLIAGGLEALKYYKLGKVHD